MVGHRYPGIMIVIPNRLNVQPRLKISLLKAKFTFFDAKIHYFWGRNYELRPKLQQT